MAAIMSSRIIRHEICKDELKKLGAKVMDIQGVMFLVKFNIKGHRITYAYHLNQDRTFYLERIKPYYLRIGDYEYEEDIIDIIKIDIEQFQNAMNSSNFSQFIEVDDHINKLVRLFEDLYLYYNISKDDLSLLDESVNHVLDNIKSIMGESQRVYTKKDPETLKPDVQFDDIKL